MWQYTTYLGILQIMRESFICVVLLKKEITLGISKENILWDIVDMLLSYHELPFWGMGMFRLRQVGGGF